MPTVFTDIEEKIWNLEISKNSMESRVSIEIDSFRNDKSTTEFEVKAIKAHLERVENHSLSLNEQM